MKLLVIVVRGLQAAAGGPFGNRWIETYTQDALAAQGVVFDTHLAVHPDPETARQVWRSGCHAFPGMPAAEPAPDLLATLRDRGVHTRLILDDGRPTPAGWDVGWDEVRREADSAAALVAAHETLDDLTETPSWLLWLELSALLPPWDLPAEIVEPYLAPPPADEDEDEDDDADAEEEEGLDYLAEEEPLDPLFAPPPGTIDPADDRLYLRIAKTYAAAVAYVDAMIGEILDGLADDIHVLLTADAGQALGEHGLVGPGLGSLHQEVVHVPLLLVGPDCRPGTHIAALTASIDLAPTIAALAGATLDGAHGRSLLPLLADEEPPWRDHLGLGGSGPDGVALGLRRAAWLYLQLGGEAGARLYVKPEDRWEVSNVRLQFTDQADRLARALQTYVEAARRPGPLQVPPLPEADEPATDDPPLGG